MGIRDQFINPEVGGGAPPMTEPRLKAKGPKPAAPVIKASELLAQRHENPVTQSGTNPVTGGTKGTNPQGGRPRSEKPSAAAEKKRRQRERRRSKP